MRPGQDRIGGLVDQHVEVDETWVGGRTRGEGRGVHHKVLVAAAVEVRHLEPGTAQDKRLDGRYAGRVRLSIAADRSAESLGGFGKSTVIPRTLVITDDWSGYNGLRTDGYDHHPIAQCVTVRRPRGFGGVHAHRPSGVLKPENLAERHSLRRQPKAPSGIPERIHVPLQSPLLSIQCLPLAPWDGRKRDRADRGGVILRRVAAPYMLSVWALSR